MKKNEPASETLLDNSTLSDLTERYAATDRHYHGLAHIEALLALARECHAELADPAAVEAAIWFHDAVYDTRSSDNEAASAALAAETLSRRVAPDRLARIVAMIEATATHTVPDLDSAAARRDTALFLDMDLSILGSAAAAFDAYEAAIRREYGWVEEPAWRAGRGAVLQSFLGRPHIFHTALFRQRFEARARENIRRSLAALGAQAG